MQNNPAHELLIEWRDVQHPFHGFIDKGECLDKQFVGG
jgi:hypothetical protein